MLIEHDGRRPVVDSTAHVAPTAVVCGDVTIGPGASICFGAVITAESGPIVIGENCIVMEAAVVRGTYQNPVTIGDNVLIGPHAYLSGCTIGDSVFLATNCTVFNGAEIGDRSEVRVNGTVFVGSKVEADAMVPIGWVAVGDPAKILSPENHDEIWAAQEPMNYPKAVFNVDRAGHGESSMPEITKRYAALLNRHKDDRMIE